MFRAQMPIALARETYACYYPCTGNASRILSHIAGVTAMSATAAAVATLETLEQTTPTDDTAPIADFRGQLPVGNRRRFMLAGRAIVTVRNPVTGNRFTFRVVKAEKHDRHDVRPDVWFVSVLTGEDSQYSYLGTIFADGKFRVTKKSRIAADAPSARAFAWFATNLESARVDVWHEGRCGRCGRALTVPESIDTGLGPICASRA